MGDRASTPCPHRDVSGLEIGLARGHQAETFSSRGLRCNRDHRFVGLYLVACLCLSLVMDLLISCALSNGLGVCRRSGHMIDRGGGTDRGLDRHAVAGICHGLVHEGRNSVGMNLHLCPGYEICGGGRLDHRAYPSYHYLCEVSVPSCDGKITLDQSSFSLP